MNSVTASELAKLLEKSPGRISQMVSAGQLDGCFTGQGRARRFDVAKVKAALGQRLDPGQLLGNGASTKAALDAMDDLPPELPLTEQRSKPSGATRLKDDDPDGYNLARTAKATEEARKLRRQNAEAEGLYVLASEVELEVKRLISQEIAEFEQVMRVGARSIADEFGVDFKTARKILIDTWRAHRAKRSGALAEAATSVKLNETEKEQDI
jgi:hypothetical protein